MIVFPRMYMPSMSTCSLFKSQWRSHLDRINTLLRVALIFAMIVNNYSPKWSLCCSSSKGNPPSFREDCLVLFSVATCLQRVIGDDTRNWIHQGYPFYSWTRSSLMIIYEFCLSLMNKWLKLEVIIGSWTCLKRARIIGTWVHLHQKKPIPSRQKQPKHLPKKSLLATFQDSSR